MSSRLTNTLLPDLPRVMGRADGPAPLHGPVTYRSLGHRDCEETISGDQLSHSDWESQDEWYSWSELPRRLNGS